MAVEKALVAEPSEDWLLKEQDHRGQLPMMIALLMTSRDWPQINTRFVCGLLVQSKAERNVRLVFSSCTNRQLSCRLPA